MIITVQFVYEKAAFEVPDFGLFCPEDFMSFHSIKILRAAAPAADPGRMVMWLYDSYIIYQMMV